MKWNEIAKNWEEFRGVIKAKWGHVTDDDLTAIAGKRRPLVDLLQVRYGFDKVEACKQVDELTGSWRPATKISSIPPVLTAELVAQ